MAFQTYNPANRTVLTFQNIMVSAVAYTNDIIYADNDLNTYHPVETLSELEGTDQLYDNDRTSSVKNRLVHLLTPEESSYFLSWRSKMWRTNNYPDQTKSEFPEGILYIALANETIPVRSHHIIAIDNYSGQPEQGWCGLHNTCLTTDNNGNTLPEMDTVTVQPVLH